MTKLWRKSTCSLSEWCSRHFRQARLMGRQGTGAAEKKKTSIPEWQNGMWPQLATSDVTRRGQKMFSRNFRLIKPGCALNMRYDYSKLGVFKCRRFLLSQAVSFTCSRKQLPIFRNLLQPNVNDVLNRLVPGRQFFRIST